MRNLAQYPITTAEKIRLLEKLKDKIYMEQERKMIVGDIDLATIVDIIKDYKTA